MPGTRYWCYTLNNPTMDEESDVPDILSSYHIWAHEVGEQGTPHIQGYVEFDNRKELTAVKRLLPSAHWEPRRGSQEEARWYVMKDGAFAELGEPTDDQPGKRNDLAAAREFAAGAQPMRQVVENCSLQGIQVAQKWLTYREQARNWVPTVIWLYGPTGVGKSRLARELAQQAYPDDPPFVKSDANKWFDGYDGHTVVIFDDLRESWFPFTFLLSLLDRYEKLVEVKGGHRQFKPRLIIIATLRAPTEEYNQTAAEPFAQLTRRITTSHELVAGDPTTLNVTYAMLSGDAQ